MAKYIDTRVFELYQKSTADLQSFAADHRALIEAAENRRTVCRLRKGITQVFFFAVFMVVSLLGFVATTQGSNDPGILTLIVGGGWWFGVFYMFTKWQWPEELAARWKAEEAELTDSVEMWRSMIKEIDRELVLREGR